MPDRLTKEQRHKCMKNIHSTETGIEVTLRKALWRLGYRYRKNVKELPGKPDIVMSKYHIVIFCDSEFFHGKDWDSSLKAQIERGSNSEFWLRKIKRNMERDHENNTKLQELGWKVLRFWGKDIEKSCEKCVQVVIDTIETQM